MDLNFDEAIAWDAIKPDLGPHLSRLPDELLPAIGKFLIIAKDVFQNEVSVDFEQMGLKNIFSK